MKEWYKVKFANFCTMSHVWQHNNIVWQQFMFPRTSDFWLLYLPTQPLDLKLRSGTNKNFMSRKKWNWMGLWQVMQEIPKCKCKWFSRFRHHLLNCSRSRMNSIRINSWYISKNFFLSQFIQQKIIWIGVRI